VAAAVETAAATDERIVAAMAEAEGGNTSASLFA